MDLATFINHRRSAWRRLEEILARVEGSGPKTLNDEQAVEFGQLYRGAASDLNQAQTFVSGDATVQYLNDLVARCYMVIYGQSRPNVVGFWRHLVFGFPAVFRRHWLRVGLAAALFVAGTVFGAAAAYLDADTAQLYLMPANLPTIQPREEEERPGMATSQAGTMISFYFTNNLRVCLIAFAMGLTLGVGTAWMMFENGLMMGVLGVAFARAGQVTKFCAEILPHGMVELPAIFIAGGAGFLLAEAIFRARPWPRVEELGRRGRQALLLVAGCVPLILAAALLETLVARAPAWLLGNYLKLSIAGVVALGFAVYVLLLGWGKWAVPEETT
ncbi:MAG TPA: stage II sporulation protein M [Gemmataceae bacterium]|nr:stage II sporulation protein M [Gemmataceae bacterium]